MVRTKFAVGDRIVWCPQAFSVFREAYAPDLERLHLRDDVLDSMPDASSELIKSPADGTMNAAIVVEVQDLSADLPGLELLKLQGVNALGDEADGAEVGDAYTMPRIETLYCDTDQHCVSLKQYVESARRLVDSTHVSVFFAAPPEGEEGEEQAPSAACEVEWEGRVFQMRVADPDDYPDSTYKACNCIWYQEVADPKNTIYVVDSDEQTDNEVSPWDTHASTSHKLWCQKFPKLAKLKYPRVERRTLVGLRAEEDPESMALDEALTEGRSEEALEQEAITRVLKRLCSNEATSLFLAPVPKSETAYYEEIDHPICLSEIAMKAKALEYDKYALFHEDVLTMVNNAMQFNETHTAEYVLSLVMHAELEEARKLLGVHAPSLVESLSV